VKDQNRAREDFSADSAGSAEVAALRERIVELEASQAQWRDVENAHRENEQTSRVMMQHMPAYVLRVERDGTIRYCNRPFEALTMDEMLGSNVRDYLPPERQAAVLQAIEGVFHAREPQSCEVPIAGTAWHAIHAAPIVMGERVESAVLCFIDITSRKRAEKLLQESDARLRALVESAHDQIFMLSCEGTYLASNDRVEQFGLEDGASLVGRHVRDVYPPEVAALYERQLRQVVVTNQAADFEHIMPQPDGDHQHLETLYPIVREGKVWAVGGICRDITERKQMEEQLRAQERMAAVGQLAAGVAHEFNNILTGTTGLAELVSIRTDVPEPVRADMRRITEGGRRAARLIRQILDFSRKSLISIQPLDLSLFLQEMAGFLQRTIPEGIHVVLEMGPEEYWVRADPGQIRQALANLAANARDAMPRGGKLRLALSRCTVGPPDPAYGSEVEPGEWITISVTDTGTGIPPEVLPHLFEPFFTTKQPGTGVGLGLAQVYGIVKQHQGFIDVRTAVGQGATFVIYLRPMDAEARELEEKAEDIAWGQRETILVVEDEPQVLAVSKAMLEHLGYTVVTATNGLQALEVYDRQPTNIALVLVDMVMPEMGGMELSQALLQRNPKIRIILMTGYAPEEAGRDLLRQGIAGWVAKPMDLTQLASVVKRALQ
jgi:two-component system cell cycle sensor histidine kinase/response regulator CckA